MVTVLGGVVSTYKVDFRVPWVRNVLLGSIKHGKCVFLVLISPKSERLKCCHFRLSLFGIVQNNKSAGPSGVTFFLTYIYLGYIPSPNPIIVIYHGSMHVYFARRKLRNVISRA
jgi:hypothetical protein